MDEHEQIQRLRELWLRGIMTWGQVFLPLSSGIVAFFVTQSRSESGWDFQLLLIGWAIFSIVIACWRWLVHRLDEQIVGMYPRMLKLDKDRKQETQTTYYYNNLHKRSLLFICEKLSSEGSVLSYEGFKNIAQSRGEDFYDLLLGAWNKYGPYSVTSRGHAFQDAFALAAVVGFFVVVLWIECRAWALVGLLLYLVILPWGQHRGWWHIKPQG